MKSVVKVYKRYWHIRKLARLSMLLLLLFAIGVCSQLASASLLGGASKIPEIREEAITLKQSLPVYAGTVNIPDSATIYSWIQGISATPHRRPGTPEGHQAEAWVFQNFQALGLQNVTADPNAIAVWTPTRWSLQVEGQSIPSFFILNSGFTPSQGVTAPMVYVGEGGSKGFSGKNVRGKIVVAEAAIKYPQLDKNTSEQFFISDPGQHLSADNQRLSFPWNLLGDFLKISPVDVYRQAQTKGAAGIVVILRDYKSNNNTFYWPYDASIKTMPGLYVSKNDGEILREQAQAGRTATLTLQGATGQGYMANIWGVLPGQSEEVILVTSHHDSPHQGAVEDGSGIAQVLAQAWAWSRVPREQRPKTLVFVAAAGHMYKGQGAYLFAKQHPDIMNRVKVVLTLEHMPAKEVKAGLSGNYVATGYPQASTIYSSEDPKVVAPVWKALDRKPTEATVCEPAFLGIPFSDAAGYVAWSKEPDSGYKRSGTIPYVSWISAPLYLLDSEDTLDKIDTDRLVPFTETVTEIVKNFMVMQ